MPAQAQPLHLRASPRDTFHNSLHEPGSQHAAYTTIDPSAHTTMAHRALLLPKVVAKIL
jgi:hypothetical protein